MKKTVHKAVKTGYGLGLLTLAEAKKVAASVKKELKLNDAESLKLAKELVSNSEKASKEVLQVAQKHFENALLKSGFVGKSELKGVKRLVMRKVELAKKKVKDRVKKMKK
ncbi:MAG: hypothetical protein KKA62_03610 [Nanoarchaeota archaeon]|nr:hypothetical protein [Nanoarchaeota archaeon]MBU1644604.1 hypothetical protein [Nanoarchaeota archaeon]MBU1977012.1 hypothetical protein [Nanoarchaeota archaeon]